VRFSCSRACWIASSTVLAVISRFFMAYILPPGKTWLNNSYFTLSLFQRYHW
jgi:hypothetical protein